MPKKMMYIHPLAAHLKGCTPAFRCDYCKMMELIERKLSEEEYLKLVKHMRLETVAVPLRLPRHMDLNAHERFLAKLKVAIKEISGVTFSYTEHGPGLRSHH